MLLAVIPSQVADAKSRARAAVLNLVTRRATPPHLWMPLLFAAVPVMEASPPAFGTADTEQLLLAIQVRCPCNAAAAQDPMRCMRIETDVRQSDAIEPRYSTVSIDGMLS